MNYLFGLIILLTTTTSYAQNETKTSLGIKAGINLAKQIQPNGGGFTDFKSDVGFYIGGTGYVPLSDKIGLAGEFIISKISSTLLLDTASFDPSDFDPLITSTIQDGSFDQTILQLPILFQVNLIDIVNLQAGPQLSYIIDSEFEGFDNEESFFLADEDVFGFDLAVGFNIRLVESLNLNGRYYFGLTKRNELKPSVFQLGVTYKL